MQVGADQRERRAFSAIDQLIERLDEQGRD